MVTDVKARLATGGTATSTTTLSDEADPATALTLKSASIIKIDLSNKVFHLSSGSI